MKMNIISLYIYYILVIPNLGLQAAQEGILARSVKIDDRSLPASSAFEGALQVSGTPGGVAFMEACPDQSPPMVHPRGATLREVLDSITADDSSYVWMMSKGVVNLEPSSGLPALLTTRLNTYDSSDATDAVSAVTLLSSSPEVRRAASKIGLSQNTLGPGLGSMAPGPLTPKKPLAIQLKNATLLDVLNAIARTNKHGVWTYHETRCGSVHQFNLSFAQ
jgi:hypothetical protein